MRFEFKGQDVEYINTDQVREDLQKDVDEFLKNGGKIRVLKSGLRSDVIDASWKNKDEKETTRKIEERKKKAQLRGAKRGGQAFRGKRK